nr:phospholipase-like protein [Tanacetum cinerariifolium]
FFEGAQATPSYGHNMATSNWQTLMPSHPGTSNWQTQMPLHSATLNWQTPMPSDHVDDFEIQFGREEFCLITLLRYGIDYSVDYKNEDDPILFRRRVFSSAKDGKPITGKMLEKIINSELFYRLNDHDAVSLSCVVILRYVLLDLGDRRKNANVKRWHPLYAAEQENVDDTKTYLVFGFTWAFKIWILESFRLGAHEYYRRQRRYPIVVAWSAKWNFFETCSGGRLPTTRLTPDENEARSDWWVSSRSYFDGRISEAARIPRHVNRQNLSDVPSESYREFEEQKRAVDQMMKKDAERKEMYDQMRKFMQDMNVGPMRQTKKLPIIVGQHYGGFHRVVRLLSQRRQTTLSLKVHKRLLLMVITWLRQTSKPLCHRILNILNQKKREVRPNMYRQTPYMDLSPTTVLPKKRGDKTKNKSKNANVSPLNLENAFADDNVGRDDVMKMGEREIGNYFMYENVDPSKPGTVQLRGLVVQEPHECMD